MKIVDVSFETRQVAGHLDGNGRQAVPYLTSAWNER